MKTYVTFAFLFELHRKSTLIAKRIIRWFKRHTGNRIILQCGIFWFDPPTGYGAIPKYVKLAACRFMEERYHAEYVENLLPPAA